MLRCEHCGRHPAKRMTFKAHQGFVLFRRETEISGVFCRDHAMMAYAAARGITLKGMWFSPSSLVFGTLRSLWDSAKLLDLPPEVKDEPWMLHRVGCPSCGQEHFTTAGHATCDKCATPFVIASCEQCATIHVVATALAFDLVDIPLCRNCKHATRAPEATRNAPPLILARAVAEISAKVARADGHVDSHERKAFREAVRSLFSLESPTIKTIDRYFERCLDEPKLTYFKGCVDNCQPEILRLIFVIAASIAQADGHVSEIEDRVLRRLAESLGLDFGTNYNESTAAPNRQQEEETWWVVLGVARTATFEQVKIAYRKLARQCHPDLWQHAPEQEQQRAALRMKVVNRAYASACDGFKTEEAGYSPRRKNATEGDARRREQAARRAAEEQEAAARREAESRAAQERAAFEEARRRATELEAERRCKAETRAVEGLAAERAAQLAAKESEAIAGREVETQVAAERAPTAYREAQASADEAFEAVEEGRAVKEDQPCDIPKAHTNTRHSDCEGVATRLDVDADALKEDTNKADTATPSAPEEHASQPVEEPITENATVSSRAVEDELGVRAQTAVRCVQTDQSREPRIRVAVASVSIAAGIALFVGLIASAVTIYSGRMTLSETASVQSPLPGSGAPPLSLPTSTSPPLPVLPPSAPLPIPTAPEKPLPKKSPTKPPIVLPRPTAPPSSPIPPPPSSPTNPPSGPALPPGRKAARQAVERGVELSKQRKPDLALLEFHSAVELDSSYYLAFCNRGIILNELQQFDLAFQDCSEAIRLMPGYSPAYGNRALANLGLSRFADAISDADLALDYDPNNGWAQYYRAVAIEFLGKSTPSEIEAQYKKARLLLDNSSYNKLHGTRKNLMRLHEVQKSR